MSRCTCAWRAASAADASAILLAASCDTSGEVGTTTCLLPPLPMVLSQKRLRALARRLTPPQAQLPLALTHDFHCSARAAVFTRQPLPKSNGSLACNFKWWAVKRRRRRRRRRRTRRDGATSKRCRHSVSVCCLLMALSRRRARQQQREDLYLMSLSLSPSQPPVAAVCHGRPRLHLSLDWRKGSQRGEKERPH